MEFKPVMSAAEAWKKASKDTSDQPDLNDIFEPAPTTLSDSILNAGGDPKRVVAWFEVEDKYVYRFVVHGSKADSAWKALTNNFDRTRYWPVILGPNESILGHNDIHLATAADTNGILTRAALVNIDQWQTELQRSRSECDTEYRRPYSQEGWPKREECENPNQLSVMRSTLTWEPLKHIWIGLFPVAACFHVPAIMRFGDWNEVPPPAIHVAIHKKWHSEFGAEQASMKSDVLEFYVSRPPTTRETAIRLAELQYDYCPDIVEQGVGTIEALAATLLNARTWYFWWD